MADNASLGNNYSIGTQFKWQTLIFVVVLCFVSHSTEHTLRGVSSTCGVSDRNIHPQYKAFLEGRSRHHKRKVSKRSVDGGHVLELYLVFDSSLFVGTLAKDRTRSDTLANEIGEHLMGMFADLGVRVVLVGVETWETDPFTVSTDASQLLDDFTTYRKTKMRTATHTRHDTAQLVTAKDFIGSVHGMAIVGSICSSASVGVVQYAHSSLSTAVTIGHEIGHVLGFLHDKDNCFCMQAGGCVMTADTSHNPMVFSSCSIEAFRELIEEGYGHCLYDLPEKVYGGPVCGNMLQEVGEVCDCGTREECLTDPCCDFGCKLKSGAQCNSGGCCENCKIKEEGMLCRAVQNECDLEEFCDGSSHKCPANLFKRDLTSCAGGNCFLGRCRSRDQQCREVWGDDATNAHGICYVSNSFGSQFGNCGLKSRNPFTYAKCAEDDVECGLLQCFASAEFPQLGDRPIKIDTKVTFQGKQLSCRGAAIFLGDDVPDPGQVTDGTPCATSTADKGVCIDRKCKFATVTPTGDCMHNCSGHGVCNNIDECLCDDGYTGVDCSVEGGPERIRTTRKPPGATTTNGEQDTSRVSTLAVGSGSSPHPGVDAGVIAAVSTVAGVVAVAGLLVFLVKRTSLFDRFKPNAVIDVKY